MIFPDIHADQRARVALLERHCKELEFALGVAWTLRGDPNARNLVRNGCGRLRKLRRELEQARNPYSVCRRDLDADRHPWRIVHRCASMVDAIAYRLKQPSEQQAALHILPTRYAEQIEQL